MTRLPTPLRVLVVDDDAMVRELLAVTFEAEGYSVQCASSGDSAIALLRPPAAPPNVILTDIQMPGIAGPQLARKLRKASGVETILLAMSGSIPPARATAPYNGFLLKPFTVQQFAAAIAVPKSPRTAKRTLPDSPTPRTLAAVFASAPQDASNIGMESHAQSAQPSPLPHAVLDSSPAATPVLNETIYQQLSVSMPASQLREMYFMCLNDARDRIAIMRTLARAIAHTADRIRFSREAHSIKGGAGMLGATEIYTLAAALEANPVALSEEASPETAASQPINSLDELSNACDRLERILVSRA